MNYLLGSDQKLYLISKAVTVLYFLSMVAWIVLEKKMLFRFGTSFKILSCFAFFCILSCFWAVNKNIALSQLVTQLQLYLLFLFSYTLFLEGCEIEVYYKALYISGFCLAAFALYRYGFSSFFINANSGIRMGGEIANENIFGMVFSFALIIAYYYYLKTNRKIHILSMILFFVFALCSGSKKAFFICIIGVIGLSLLLFDFKNIWKVLLIIVISFGLGYLLIKYNLFAGTFKRISSFLTGNFNISDNNRMNYIKKGIELIKQRPVLGYGLKNYGYVTGFGTYSHNNYIEILVSLGMVGFIIYYSAFVVAGYRLFNYLSYGKELVFLVLLLLMGINIVFGYGRVQFYSKDTWLFFGVLLGTTDKFIGLFLKDKDLCLTK